MQSSTPCKICAALQRLRMEGALTLPQTVQMSSDSSAHARLFCNLAQTMASVMRKRPDHLLYIHTRQVTVQAVANSAERDATAHLALCVVEQLDDVGVHHRAQDSNLRHERVKQLGLCHPVSTDCLDCCRHARSDIPGLVHCTSRSLLGACASHCCRVCVDCIAGCPAKAGVAWQMCTEAAPQAADAMHQAWSHISQAWGLCDKVCVRVIATMMNWSP